MLIGLTGKNACGKGEIAQYLIKKGFSYWSLSDVLRQIMKEQNIFVSRQNMIDSGNKIRQKKGNGVLAEFVLEKLDKNKNYVIDSVRYPEEVNILDKFDKFILLNIEAPAKLRFVRIQKRKRKGDPQTYKEFLYLEKKELTHLNNCKKLSDYTIENNSTRENLYNILNRLLKKILMNNKRPSWDEYFINIAKVVSTRSNCMKRKVASIIVKDKRIISTGYNGTPKGTKNCNEGGCPRCNNLEDTGTSLEECFCSHAEENAIVQSAYHGISVRNSTLYTTYSPCLLCAKMIINSGISEIVYNEEYALNKNALKLLKEAKVIVKKI